jgi:hypothetical protein
MMFHLLFVCSSRHFRIGTVQLHASRTIKTFPPSLKIILQFFNQSATGRVDPGNRFETLTCRDGREHGG